MAKNILVGLSGGPSVAINASLAGIIRGFNETDEFDNIYGCVNGIEGVLNRRIIDLSNYSDENSLKLLEQTPAMCLGSCRKKITEDDFPQIEQVFLSLEINTFFYIGGNDSMDTVLKLDNYFKSKFININVIGVPKTIDNDLPVTDHTPGYGSACKYLHHTMEEIIRDSEIYPVKNVVIVEIMGRDSGWLTIAAGLPNFLGGTHPDIVAIPEVAFDQEKFIEKINKLLTTQDLVVCVVSEGIREKSGSYVGMDTKSGAVDNFGHAYLSGVSKYLEHLAADRIGCKVRSIELNVLQRASSIIASKSDIDEAVLVGKHAVELAKNNKTGIMVVITRNDTTNGYEFQLTSTSVGNVANKRKDVPKYWYDLENQYVKIQIVNYLIPLTHGEMDTIRDNIGLPVHLKIDKTNIIEF